MRMLCWGVRSKWDDEEAGHNDDNGDEEGQGDDKGENNNDEQR